MIKPIHDYVLLEAVPVEKKVGAIILTSEKKKAGNLAIVRALGDGKKDENGNPLPFQVKLGDKVVYRDYAGTEVEEGEHTYILLKEEDILALLEEEGE